MSVRKAIGTALLVLTCTALTACGGSGREGPISPQEASARVKIYRLPGGDSSVVCVGWGDGDSRSSALSCDWAHVK